ncbi:MAG TPA: SURF1 family protein [Rudaea sp.]|jgi:cytochrome oxidase assembly protein ShyY1|nr:SURF1 family protein [Rudaea sp.]
MTTRRWRRPTAFAWILTAFGVAAFCALGTWQIDRAVQKRQLFAAFADAANAPALDFAQASAAAAESQRYPHLRVTGHFVTDRGYWLDEQFDGDRVGVHAIGVFAIEGHSGWLLVDRGWVAWSHASGVAPTAPAPQPGEIVLTGLYSPFPGGGLRLGGNALPGQATWPKLTLFLDAKEIAADLGRAVQPRMLLLDPEPGNAFVRSWKPQVFPPERHIGYAVTWFGFAIVALIIFIVLHWVKVEK